MRVNLPTKGQSHVNIQYDTEQLVAEHLQKKFSKGIRTTKLSVVLPSGEVLETKVACHTTDIFNRKQGRKAAFLKLICADTNQATNAALEAFQGNVLKSPEKGSLKEAAKKYYKLSREDRRAIFAVVCPEYFRNTPERRALREKLLFERLKAKYGKVENEASHIENIAAK